MTIHLIPKYQQGGGAISPPYVVYQPLPTANTSGKAAAQSSGSSDDKGLNEKDFAQLYKDYDGLPSDRAVIDAQLQNFFSSIGHETSTARVASAYSRILGLIKDANFSKERFDKAYDQVSKNGGINEVAVNERGQFFCYNREENDYKLMTAEELKENYENGDGYSPMTNSELLYFRANDPSMAHRDELLSVVNNGLGLETVTNQILTVVRDLGTAERTEEGYMSTSAGRLIGGYEDFIKAVQEASGHVPYDGTADDLYKYKQMTKSQMDAADAAFAYIYSMLPENARALLKMKSGEYSESGAKKLMQQLVASRVDTNSEFTLTREKATADKGKTGTSSDKDQTKLENSQLVSMVEALGAPSGSLTVDKGTGIQMSVWGKMFPVITDKQGNSISEDTSLGAALADSLIQGIAITDNITFGDQKIKKSDLNYITYNNTGMVRANLPIKSDGTVDFTVLDRYEKVEAKLAALGREPTKEELDEAFKSEGLGDYVKANGELDETKFGPFLVTEGYTTDALTGIKPSEFVHSVDKWHSKGEADIIQRSLTNGNSRKGFKVDTNSGWPGDWFGLWDQVYKAAVYIPITTNIALAARLDGQHIDWDTESYQQEANYQNYPTVTGMMSTSASALKNE